MYLSSYHCVTKNRRVYPQGYSYPADYPAQPVKRAIVRIDQWEGVQDHQYAAWSLNTTRTVFRMMCRSSLSDQLRR
jgi:hypothetical protein